MELKQPTISEIRSYTKASFHIKLSDWWITESEHNLIGWAYHWIESYLKTLCKPPPAVNKVMQATFILLGNNEQELFSENETVVWHMLKCNTA